MRRRTWTRRRRPLSLFRPQLMLVGTACAVVAWFTFALGWLQLSKFAAHRLEGAIERLSHKLNIPIDVGRVAITPSGAYLDDLRLGADGAVVINRITAEIGLNPFSANFAALDEVSIDRVVIKVPAANARQQLSELNVESLGSLLGDGGRGDRTQRSLAKLFAAMPAQRLYIASGAAVLTDESGREQVSAKGVKLLIDKRPNRVLFNIASLATAGGLTDELLQGRLELQPKTSSYRFFVRRKLSSGPDDDREASASHDGTLPPRLPNAWAVSGVVPADLSTAALTIELRRLPALLPKEVVADIEGMLGHAPHIDLRAKIDLAHDNDAWRFNAHLQSLGTIVQIPLISARPIGPLYFDAQTKGRVHPSERMLTLDAATFTLPDRRTHSYEKLRQNPVVIRLKAQVQLTASNAPQGKPQVGRWTANAAAIPVTASGHVELATAPCQSILDASPAGLFPAVVDFKLAGTAGAGVDFRYDSAHPEAAVVDLQGATYGCKVVAAPYAYSAEHLAGPFALQRQGGKNDATVSVAVNPQAPDYTPLESIAKTVNLTFIAAEDASFYAHRGIDADAINYALRRDLSEQRIAVGGSTITMQTVKNLFLGHERTLSRKAQELFLAWHLENILSKERILEIYLNIVELGPGVYGIKSAAQHYFGKHPFDLSLLESAYLATLLPAPKTRHRYFCANGLTPGMHELVNGLLRRMMNLGRISPERYQQTIATTLQFNDETRHADAACKIHPTNDDEDAPPNAPTTTEPL